MKKKGCLPRCLGSFSFQADGALPADQVRFLCGVLRANPAGGGGVGPFRERAAPHPDRALMNSVLKLATVVDDLADGGIPGGGDGEGVGGSYGRGSTAKGELERKGCERANCRTTRWS